MSDEKFTTTYRPAFVKPKGPSEHKFTVIIAGRGARYPGEATLVLDGVTLDPAKYDDWLLGGRYLKLADPENFPGWVSWSNQVKDQPKPTDMVERMRARWDSFTEVVGPAVTDFTPSIAGLPGTIVDSPKNAIAAALDRFTDVSGNAVHVTDLAGLQEALNSLIAPPVTAQVLQARGKTMIELVALGLLNDDDMANHMADCFTAITGKPCTAKHAEAFIASLRGLQTLLSGVAVQSGDKG